MTIDVSISASPAHRTEHTTARRMFRKNSYRKALRSGSEACSEWV